jgi:hypothetical protein
MVSNHLFSHKRRLRYPSGQHTAQLTLIFITIRQDSTPQLKGKESPSVRTAHRNSKVKNRRPPGQHTAIQVL